MDGIKLGRAVRARRPPIEIIVTSEFSGSERKLLTEGSQFIPKPYNATQISDALHRLAPESRVSRLGSRDTAAGRTVYQASNVRLTFSRKAARNSGLE
jgi:hypothetical protein